jgi:hypothetical protein
MRKWAMATGFSQLLRFEGEYVKMRQIRCMLKLQQGGKTAYG